MPEPYAIPLSSDKLAAIQECRDMLTKVAQKLSNNDVEYLMSFGDEILQKASDEYIMTRLWIILSTAAANANWERARVQAADQALQIIGMLLNGRPLMMVDALSRYYQGNGENIAQLAIKRQIDKLFEKPGDEPEKPPEAVTV